MYTAIRQLIFAWHYRRAVKKAVTLSKTYGMKFYVLYLNGRLRIVPKQAIRELIARHRFRKGTTIADIEKRTLFITH